MDADRIMGEVILRMGRERAVKLLQSIPLPSFSGRFVKDFAEGRGEVVLIYFEAVDAGVFA